MRPRSTRRKDRVVRPHGPRRLGQDIGLVIGTSGQWVARGLNGQLLGAFGSQRAARIAIERHVAGGYSARVAGAGSPSDYTFSRVFIRA
jgi:hypothetical protein